MHVKTGFSVLSLTSRPSALATTPSFGRFPTAGSTGDTGRCRIDGDTNKTDMVDKGRVRLCSANATFFYHRDSTAVAAYLPILVALESIPAGLS